MSVAQGNNLNYQIEFIAENSDDMAVVHLRLPRGQTVEEAVLSQGDLDIVLTPDIQPLPITQFILLDTGEGMESFESAIQSSIQRFWRSGDQRTSLIFYDNETDVLSATNNSENLDNFLAGYTVSSGETACLADALSEINNLIRAEDQSWRILLVTAGDFARESSCVTQLADKMPAPAPLDVIVISDIDDNLQNFVDRSGGQFYTANLRNLQERSNEVLTQWGQSTYALRGEIPDGWNSDEPFDFDLVLSNEFEDSVTLSFLDYNIYIPPTPTPMPTATEPLPTVAATATAEPTAIGSGVTSVEPTENIQNTDTSTNEPDSGFAVLLIVGAVLFVVGAVVLALALSRIRRAPVDDRPQPSGNFYDTLQTPKVDTESSLSATRVREREIFSEPQTQLASLDDTFMAEDNIDDDNDALLVTQVLTDERFQTMMEQSVSIDEVVGWMRLIIDGDSGTEPRDFELTPRGAVIGRSQDCDIQITGDRAISRQHARLDVRSNGQVTVSRLSAVNPVVVGGVQVSNRHPLTSNDVVHLSDQTRLIFIANDSRSSDDDDEQDISDT